MSALNVPANETAIQHGAAEKGKVMLIGQMIEAMLRRDEATRLKVYDDKTGKPLVPGTVLVGHPTIGTGRALDTNGLSQHEADYLLAGDIYRVREEAEKAFPWYGLLLDSRKAVILSMLFQIGLPKVLGFKEMLLACEHQNWARAAAEMRDSAWHKETPARSERLAVQMETGVYQP